MRAVATRYANPIAERIATYSRESGVSLSQLSTTAGLSRSTAQKVCDRLENAEGDVGLATLTALATAMGRTLTWLLYGDAPPERVLLGTLAGWSDAAREAVDRFGVDAVTVDAIGRWSVHEAPARVDAMLVVELARAFRR